jgi:hypothetical protein
MTPQASEWGVEIVGALNDARAELDRKDYLDLIWFVGQIVLRQTTDAWAEDPDAPEGFR